MSKPAAVIHCPVCCNTLNINQSPWHCINGHSFDLARQGYANLLLVQQKKSKAPGDTIEMVDARQRILDRGLYQNISQLLNQQVFNWAQTQTQALHIADIGCGEGYYTHRLEQQLEQLPQSHQLYGLDISKDALRRATKRSQSIYWLVASGSQPPFIEHSLDAVVSLFTSLMPQGLNQALKPAGQVFLINTGSQHLIELRQLIYPNVNMHVFDPTEKMTTAGFALLDHQALSYKVTLTSSEQIIDLLKMTPHWWRITAEALANLEQLNELTLSIDINCHHFSKSPE